jgi:hypothetical protein
VGLACWSSTAYVRYRCNRIPILEPFSGPETGLSRYGPTDVVVTILRRDRHTLFKVTSDREYLMNFAPPPHRRILQLAAAALLIGCSPPPAPNTEIAALTRYETVDACPRFQARQWSAGDTIVVADPPDFPCQVAVQPFVTLRPDESGAYPDPSDRAAYSPRGRIFTASLVGGPAVAVWDTTGTFLRTIGERGQGPGEISPTGALLILVGAGDSLFVRDGPGLWSVFDSAGNFGRSFRGDGTGRFRGALHMTPAGFLSSSYPIRNATGHSFTVANLAGSALRSFGPTREAASEIEQVLFRRASSYAGGSTFWVAPRSGPGNPAVFEEWSLQGDLRRVLRRETSWSRTSGRPPKDASGKAIPVPAYEMFHVDPDGLLWYFAWVPKETTRRFSKGSGIDSESFEGRLEVIDPEAATVLVSTLVRASTAESEMPFTYFFPATRLAYRSRADSVGLQSLEVLRAFVVPRSGH